VRLKSTKAPLTPRRKSVISLLPVTGGVGRRVGIGVDGTVVAGGTVVGEGAQVTPGVMVSQIGPKV